VDQQQEARLLELYYGLLSEEEAAELRDRIASDPQWAEAWAQTQQMAASLGEAARFHADRVDLPRSDQLQSEEPVRTASAEPPAHPVLLSESVRPGWPPSGAKPSPKLPPPRRTDRWALGVVYGGATVLVAVAFWGAMLHWHHLLTLTGGHLRLVVQGPSVLRVGVENRFLVFTSRVHGAPVESQVELALFGPDQKRFFSQKETADEQGQVQVVLPADMDLPRWVILKVTAEARGKRESCSARLETAPVDYQTFLGLDRFYYRRGDKVLFRSLSVPRFRRSVQEEMWVELEVRDGEDRPVPGSYQEGRTWQGIGYGEFRIPSDMPSGLYTLVARNAQRRFPEVRKPFWVLPEPDERFQATVKFQKPPYSPGQTITAEIEVWEKGRAAPKQSLEVWAEVSEGTIYRQTLSTDAHGQAMISFRLPEQISGSEAWLWIKLPSSQPPVLLWKQILLASPKIECQFYPEGGLLAAGVENRVYFSVRDRQGRPVEVRGVLLDMHDRQIANVHSTHLGRGVFQFVPLEGQRYRLRIDEPAGISQEAELPPVSSNVKILVRTGLGVVGPGQPVEFHIVTPKGVKTQTPLMATVLCRGVQAARQWVVPQTPKDGQPAETAVQISLPPDVWGLLRLQVYDYGQPPPVLLAERLLYRLPHRRIRVELTGPPKTIHPTDPVQVRVTTKDDQATAISAVSGVSVVEEKFLGAMSGLCPISPCWFLDEIWELPEDLEQAEYLLSDRPESRVAFDLLLGTWGGRTPASPSAELSGLTSEKRGNPPIKEPAPSSPSPDDAPPLLLDNLHRILASYQEAMEVLQKDRPGTLNAITLSSLLGGAALVLFVLLANLLQVSGGFRIWAPALIGASLCGGVGLVLAHPELLHPGSPYAVPFAEYPPSEGAESSSSSRQGEFDLGPSAEKEPVSAFSPKSSQPQGDASSTKAPSPVPLPRDLSGGLVHPFGIPRTTARRLLSAGAEEAHQLGWEAWIPTSKEAEEVQSEKPASLPQPKPPDSPASRGTSGAASSAARTSDAIPSSPAPKPKTSTDSNFQVGTSDAVSPLPGSRFVIREYAYRAHRSPTSPPPEKNRQPVLLYWHPFFLIGPEGSAECRFDTPELPGVFRIRVDVHAAEGYMTLAELKITSASPASASANKSSGLEKSSASQQKP